MDADLRAAQEKTKLYAEIMESVNRHLHVMGKGAIYAVEAEKMARRYKPEGANGTRSSH